MKPTLSFGNLLASTAGGQFTLTPDQVASLEAHYSLLEKWNRKLNLTSIRRMEDAVVRHYAESLFLGMRLPAGVSVVDIGSGAGFPGIPMAVLRPECSFTLVESHQRKAVFLKEATRGYANIRVAACRADEVDPGFDWMVSRAVRWSELPRLGRTVALLLGAEDAEKASIPGISWQDRIALPWGERRVLLIGS